jgi:hypothetical protein
MKQSDAVFNVTTQVLASHGISFTPGETIIHDVITKEARAAIADRLVSLFQEGQVEFKDTPANQAKLQDPKLLRSYIAGLITNWHNKDKRLNAGAKYEAKNPGSRQGAQDPVIKELKTLLKHLEDKGDDANAQKVQEAIESRLAEIKPSAAADTPTINLDVIPEHLRDLVS